MKTLRILETGWLIVAIFLSILLLSLVSATGFDNDAWFMLFATIISFVMYFFRRKKRMQLEKENQIKP